MKKSRIFKPVFGLVLLLGTLLAVPYFLPLAQFVPRIEREAAARLGMPVRIGALHLSILPTPRLGMSGLRLGTGDVEIQKIAIVPALGTLFDDTRVIRLIEIEGLSVRDSVFGKLLATQRAQGPAPVRLERLHVSGMKLSMGTVTLILDELGVSLDQQSTRVVANDLKARLYGGSLAGQLRLDWGRQSQLGGDFVASGIDVGALSRALAPRPVQTVTGRLAADARFSALAPTIAGLVDAIQLDGKFNVANGVLHNFDFASAVKSAFGGKVKGGETRFEALRGDAGLRGRNVQLRNLVIASGLLKGNGNVDISRSGQLAGVVDIELKNTMGVVGVPVAISGTIKEPQLGLTTGTKIGAAAGTVLAPGVGTSLGASIGRFFEKKTAK